MNPPKLLRRAEVLARTTLTTSSLYSKMAEGSFPCPVKVGRKAVAWREADVNKWIEGLTEAAIGKTPRPAG